VEHTLASIKNFEPTELPEVISVDAESRRIALSRISNLIP
jgi:hypothetical protein